MTSQSSQPTNARILKNPVILLIFVVCIALIILNIAIYGKSDYWTTFVTTIFNPLFAFIVTILAVVLLVQVLPNARARALWLGLVIGWACWTVAEFMWTYYFIKGQDVPYPSLADLFWCVGYIPMGVVAGVKIALNQGKNQLVEASHHRYHLPRRDRIYRHHHPASHPSRQ